MCYTFQSPSGERTNRNSDYRNTILSLFFLIHSSRFVFGLSQIRLKSNNQLIQRTINRLRHSTNCNIEESQLKEKLLLFPLMTERNFYNFLCHLLFTFYAARRFTNRTVLKSLVNWTQLIKEMLKMKENNKNWSGLLLLWLRVVNS